MPNNFNLNDNKERMNGHGYSYTTFRGNFANDAQTLMCGGVPNTTPIPTTFTVTFTNSDNGGTSATYTAQPFETIGNAIHEKDLSVTDYYPTYRYNESIVTEDCENPIKGDITINVTWTKKAS